jgi:hypothetical protein
LSPIGSIDVWLTFECPPKEKDCITQSFQEKGSPHSIKNEILTIWRFAQDFNCNIIYTKVPLC